jgi:hypothetical protein
MPSHTVRRAAALAASVVLSLAAAGARAEKTEHADSVKGFDKKTYTVSAKAGQTLVVWMKSNSSFAFFNVTPLGADEAIWTGSQEGKEKAFSQKLDKDAEYEIEVYLAKAEARRQGKADFTLTVSLD